MIPKPISWFVRAAAAALLVLLLAVAPPATAQTPKRILALGSLGSLDDAGVLAATGLQVAREAGTVDLKQQFSVVFLANVAFGALPEAVQQGLPSFVSAGGTLLITGGPQAFGSGGYEAIADLVPFGLRSQGDWRFTPFRSPVPVQPGHPVLTGVAFDTIGAVNDMNPRPGATEILRMPGGGSSGYPSPLIAEVGAGAGRVLGFAFDLNDLGGMRDRDLLVQNALRYLAVSSR
jgi:hypothetical protein